MKSNEEIKQLAEDYWEGCDGCDANDKYFFVKGFEGAYRQLQEDMAEKYTEQDMIKFAFDNYYQEDMANKDKWSFEEILDACYPTLGRGSDWCDIVKRLREQKLNKQD